MSKCIIAVGNPFDGLTLYGPFEGPTVASEWAEPGSNSVTDLKDVPWTVVPLENPYPIDETDVLENERDFDDFLDDATHAIREMWQDRGGQKMGDGELYALNDVLTQFFADKKSPR